MHTDPKARRQELMENITHYITAFVVLMKGIDKVGTPGKGWLGALFIFFASVIVAGTLFHTRFEKLLHHFKAYTFAIEAIVLAAVGILYAKEGKHFVQYAFFAASVLFLVALIAYVARHRTGNSRKTVGGTH